MKHDQWLGIVIFVLILALQLVLQRKERPAAKWLGGGIIVIGGILWILVSSATPGIRPIGVIVTWLESRVPIP